MCTGELFPSTAGTARLMRWRLAMSKTSAEYLAAEPTPNQIAFLKWATAESGVTFKTAAERAAFEKGVRVAGLYSRYQQAKREMPAPTAKTPKKTA